MRKVFKFILMLIIPLVYVLIAHRSVAQSASMDIKTAINTALTNNRSLRSDSLDISISNSKNRELAGFYKPQVNYSTNTEYNPAIPSQMLPGAVTGVIAEHFGLTDLLAGRGARHEYHPIDTKSLT